MCWVIRVGGQSAGRPISTALSASTPPVDAPMKTILPVGRRRRSRRGARRRHRRGARRREGGRGFDLALQFRRQIRHAARPDRRVGLATKSTAPISSASSVVSAPRLGQRRDHHDRHRPQRHDLAQERQAVHMRHLDVERDDVGIERLDLFARDMRIGRCRRLRFRDLPPASSTATAASQRNCRRSEREPACSRLHHQSSPNS